MMVANLDDRRILFTALDEFLVSEVGIHVAVHILEDLLHSLILDIKISIRVTNDESGSASTFSGVSSSCGSLTI